MGRHGRHPPDAKFLGNVPLPMVEKLLTTMQLASDQFQAESPGEKLHLRLSGLGMFPNPQQPRVLWAGTEGDLDLLAALQMLVDQAVADLGYSLEKRPFRPHLTIGRVRDSTPQQLRQPIPLSRASHVFDEEFRPITNRSVDCSSGSDRGRVVCHRAGRDGGSVVFVRPGISNGSTNPRDTKSPGIHIEGSEHQLAHQMFPGFSLDGLDHVACYSVTAIRVEVLARRHLR